MKIITKGSNYSSCGLGVLVAQDLKEELTAVFGAEACTDERMIAIQKLMARLDWYNNDGIYGKLSFIMLPFMCNGTPSTNAFYDLKSKRKISAGYNPVVTDANISQYYAFDSYGCYIKKNTTDKVNGFGYPMTGVKAWNSSEFALFKRLAYDPSAGRERVGSCGTSRIISTPIYGHVDAQRSIDSSNYLSFSLVPDTPELTARNFCCYVFTGDWDINISKALSNAGECNARSVTGALNSEVDLSFVSFGEEWKLAPNTASENFSFSVMGHAVALTLAEARILRDALMEFKKALNL